MEKATFLHKTDGCKRGCAIVWYLSTAKFLNRSAEKNESRIWKVKFEGPCTLVHLTQQLLSAFLAHLS